MLNSDVLYNITLFWETGCYISPHHLEQSSQGHQPSSFGVSSQGISPQRVRVITLRA